VCTAELYLDKLNTIAETDLPSILHTSQRHRPKRNCSVLLVNFVASERKTTRGLLCALSKLAHTGVRFAVSQGQFHLQSHTATTAKFDNMCNTQHIIVARSSKNRRKGQQYEEHSLAVIDLGPPGHLSDKMFQRSSSRRPRLHGASKLPTRAAVFHSASRHELCTMCCARVLM
jgi:hypothetical protein